jgi:hypothetical protein
VCKHCQRDLPSSADPIQSAVATATVVKSSPVRTIVRLAVFLLVGCAGLATLAMIVSIASAPGKPSTSKTYNVKLAWSALELQITNPADSAAIGRPLTVYINGTPPFTYRADTTMPAVGESVRIPLNEFVTKGGDRFNPVTQALTVVWIGGGEYDYQSYSTR